MVLSLKKTLIFSLVAIVALSVVQFSYAQDSTDGEAVDGVTTEDFGVDNPGVLPTNPFYFFKEFTRGLRGLFIFDPVKRAEYELRIVNQKAAEIRSVESAAPGDIEHLFSRLESLAEDSDNPNIGRLLDQLTEGVSKHHQLLDGLYERHVEIRGNIENTQDNLDEAVSLIFGAATCEELKSRLGTVLENDDHSPEDTLSLVRLLNRVEGLNDSDQVLSCVGDVRVRLVGMLDKELEDSNVDIGDLLDRLRWRETERLRVINEIREMASDRLRLRLEDLRLGLLSRINEDGVDASDAKEAISDADRLVSSLRDKVDTLEDAPDSVDKLLAEASDFLDSAKQAFDGEDYVSAFREASDAIVSARSGIAMLERLNGQKVDDSSRVRDDSGDVEEPEEDETEEKSDDSRGRYNSIPLNIDKLIPGSSNFISCIEIYNPVCGSDGREYSNECFARAAGARVVDNDICERGKDDRDR